MNYEKSKIYYNNILCYFLIYYFVFYGHRVRSNFGVLKDEMLVSNVLIDRVGKIKNIYFDNYLFLYDKYNGEDCIKFNVYNSNFKKTDVCALPWIYYDIEKNTSELKAIGYVLKNDEIIYDISSFKLSNYDDKLKDYNIVDMNKKINNYIDLKNLCQEYLNLDNNFNEEYFYDSSNETWLYISSLYNINYETKKRHYYKNNYLIINSNGQILTSWEKN